MKTKILIVDDELLVRIGIKSCIEWTEYGVEVIGEAADGFEALKLIYQLKPDLILLDIKMPNMDGIELMKKIKGERLDCKILVLSGFDDLQHVKEAMKLGALDYLHKPCMNSNNILEAVMNAKKILENEERPIKVNSNSINGLGKSREILKEIYLKELLDGQAVVESEFVKRCSEYQLRLNNANFSCLVFSVKNILEVQKRYQESNLSILQSSIYNTMSSVLSKEAGTEFFLYNYNIYVIIISAERMVSEKAINKNIDSIVYLTSDALEQFLNIDIVIGVSDIHKSCRGIKPAFDEALKAMKHRFYLEAASTIYYRDLPHVSKQDSLDYISSCIEKLKENLTNHNYVKFNSILDQMIDYVESKACLSEDEVKKLFNAFLLLIKGAKDCFSEMERINQCETLKELYSVWKEIIAEKLESCSENGRYQNCSYLVKKILEFIEENYDKEISLILLSKSFNISPNYISRHFKEETGEALFNYIYTVRIEKAKKMLRNSDLKIYEVGYKVGFKSSVHFNIVFSKLTGHTPKQYKDNLL